MNHPAAAGRRPALVPAALSPARVIASLSAPARRWLAITAMLCGLLFLCVSLQSLQLPAAYRKDFIQEYLLARAAAAGVDPYLPVRDLAALFLGPLPVPAFPHATPHPPPVALVALPLSLLAYPPAAIAWMLLELACIFVTVQTLLAALWGVRRPLPALALGLAALALAPFWQELVTGQLMCLLMMLAVLAWQTLRRGKDVTGGLLLGLTIALKFVTWPLLLLLVVRRRWQAAAAAGAAILVANLAAALLLGPAALAGYYLRVLPQTGALYRACEHNVSLYSLGWRLFDGMGSPVLIGATAPPLFASIPLAQVVALTVPALLLVPGLLAARRSSDFDVTFALVLGISLLVSPIAWSHYLVLLALPLCLAAARLAGRRWPAADTLLLALVLALLTAGDGQLHSLLALFASSPPGPDGAFVVAPAPALLSMLPACAVLLLLWLLRRMGSKRS